ncbi:MFS transporter (plasmid) [Streptomyces sp. NBC_01450]|uniref:MFS transporter n=1 Tax=Streptomyces sp. NBC_01450 TaxID=2903871 RepID=UPI002E2F90EA|nr:MFS transporter [Streptomyces sp. NBC_01450]
MQDERSVSVSVATDPGAASPAPAAAALAPPPAARRRGVLLVAMAATFMAMMDSYIVNVAVPSLRSDLDASVSAVEMTVGGYILVYGLFLVTGGRLGDIVGHKRMFLAGLGLFTAASLACGSAPGMGSLIAFRCVQGLSAALFFPQILSVIQTTFEGARRERALALFGVTIGLAAITGQLIGGVLVRADLFGWGWRPIFLVNVPLGLVVIAGAAATMPGVEAGRRARPRLDVPGVGLLTLALLLLSFPLAEGRTADWPWWCFALMGLSVPFFAVFGLWERKLAADGGQPLVAPGLLRLRGYRSGNAVFLAFFASNAGLFFVLAVQLQSGLGYSALQAGLLFAPLAVAFTTVSLVVPRVSARLGLHALTAGYGLNALGYLLLLLTSLAAGDDLTGPLLIPALVVIGVGQGLGVSPLLGAALADVPPQEAGSAAGVLETVGQFGMSLGIALVGLLYFSTLDAASSPHAYAHAFTVTLVLNLLLSLLALAFVPPLRKAAAGPTGS